MKTGGAVAVALIWSCALVLLATTVAGFVTNTKLSDVVETASDVAVVRGCGVVACSATVVVLRYTGGVVWTLNRVLVSKFNTRVSGELTVCT